MNSGGIQANSFAWIRLILEVKFGDDPLPQAFQYSIKMTILQG